MNKCIFFCSTFILLLCLTIELPAQSSLSRLKVEGNKLVNEQIETLVFRGYNTSDPDKLVYDDWKFTPARQGKYFREVQTKK